MSAPWVAKKHHMFVTQGQRARAIIADVIPQALVLEETALHAEVNAQLLLEESTSSAATRWPTSPEELTSTWIHNEVARRVGVRDIDVQLQVLREVIFNARTGANELVDQHADELIGALADQLDALLTELTARVDDLGPGVSTAAEAIEAGTVDAWSSIHRTVVEYRDIRAAQNVFNRALWGATDWPFDRKAAGDSSDVSDPEARLYYHRRIAEVAPLWRADRRADSTGKAINESTVPWPQDPTERLIWCIRNDSGIWCPTADQMQALLSGEVPERRGKGIKRAGLQRRESEKAILGKAPIIIHNSQHG